MKNTITATIGQWRILPLPLMLLALGNISEARATTVLSDGFTNATQNATTQAIDSEISWYAFAASGGQLPTKVTPTTGGLIGDSVLQFSAQSQKTALVGSIAPVSLTNAGDSIKLSVTYAYRYAPSSSGLVRGLAIGLYNSNGTAITAGSLTSGTGNTSDDLGYRVGKMPNSTTNDLVLGKETGALTDFPTTATDQHNSSVLLNDTASYTLSLEISLQVDGSLLFTYGVNASTFTYLMDSSLVTTTTFNEILLSPIGRGLGTDAANPSIFLGNVELSVVPEPSSLGLALLGAVSLVVSGFQRRKK